MISLIFLGSWFILGLITLWIFTNAQNEYEDSLTFKQKIDLMFCSPLIWMGILVEFVFKKRSD